MAQSARGGWSLIFMATFMLGNMTVMRASLPASNTSMNAQGASSSPSGSISTEPSDDSPIHLDPDSDQASDGQSFQPVLQPSKATPLIGTYRYAMGNKAGKPCVEATMGIEYIVIENKKSLYYNVDPTNVTTSGECSNDTAVLRLTLPNNAASLMFTFKKEGNVSYVTTVNAHIKPQPACKECTTKDYAGVMDHETLFKTSCGLSFKCNSQLDFDMSSSLRINLVPLQIQAFDIPEENYGPEVECWADFNKRVIPIVVGAAVAGIFLIALLTYLSVRHRRRGYSQI